MTHNIILLFKLSLNIKSFYHIHINKAVLVLCKNITQQITSKNEMFQFQTVIMVNY
jgi:hypothetical protein